MSQLRRFTYLELPGEIRNEIYSLLLEVEETDKRAGRGNILFIPTKGIRLRHPKVHPAILATNHQIHDEAADFLYGKNTFHCFMHGGMTGSEFPLEALQAFTAVRYFSLISRWAIMVRFRDHSDKDSCIQLPRHFSTLCHIIAQNNLTEVRIEFVNSSHQDETESLGQVQHMKEVLDQARVLRNVKTAKISAGFDSYPTYHTQSNLSSDYLDDLKEVMEGP